MITIDLPLLFSNLSERIVPLGVSIGCLRFAVNLAEILIHDGCCLPSFELPSFNLKRKPQKEKTSHKLNCRPSDVYICAEVSADPDSLKPNSKKVKIRKKDFNSPDCFKNEPRGFFDNEE